MGPVAKHCSLGDGTAVYALVDVGQGGAREGPGTGNPFTRPRSHNEAMRMQFDLDDEKAFYARRDALGEQFAQWLTDQKVVGDPNVAGWLMEWKVGYGDGALDRWSVADVGEFLFDWCPRKVSAPPKFCAEFPPSVAAFVEFLAHTGLLAPGGDPPSQIRRYCE